MYYITKCVKKQQKTGTRPVFYFFHFHSILDSVPDSKRLIFSRCRHMHNRPMARNAKPTCVLIANPKIGIKQNTITAPKDDIPDVSATNNHSIPQTTKDKGLTANNTPNKQEIPLPPLNFNQTG